MRFPLVVSLLSLIVSAIADDTTTSSSIGSSVVPTPSFRRPTTTNVPLNPNLYPYPDAPGFYYTDREFETLGRQPRLSDMLPNDANYHTPVVGPLSADSILAESHDYFREHPDESYYQFPYGQWLRQLLSLSRPDYELEQREANEIVNIRAPFISPGWFPGYNVDESRPRRPDRARLPFEGSKEDYATFKSLVELIKNKLQETESQSPDSGAMKESREIEDPCPICLDSLGLIDHMRLPCKHQFHSDCVQVLVEKNIRKCPVCRTQFSLKSLIDTNTSPSIEQTTATN